MTTPEGADDAPSMIEHVDWVIQNAPDTLGLTMIWRAIWLGMRDVLELFGFWGELPWVRHLVSTSRLDARPAPRMPIKPRHRLPLPSVVEAVSAPTNSLTGVRTALVQHDGCDLVVIEIMYAGRSKGWGLMTYEELDVFIAGMEQQRDTLEARAAARASI